MALDKWNFVSTMLGRKRTEIKNVFTKYFKNKNVSECSRNQISKQFKK